jgi:hypothetical protein
LLAALFSSIQLCLLAHIRRENHVIVDGNSVGWTIIQLLERADEMALYLWVEGRICPEFVVVT